MKNLTVNLEAKAGIFNREVANKNVIELTQEALNNMGYDIPLGENEFVGIEVNVIK